MSTTPATRSTSSPTPLRPATSSCIHGEDAIPFPEDGYQGGDIKDLAKAYYDQHGDKLLNVSAAGAAGRPGPVRPVA